MAGMLDHALLYADAGFPVLPLHSPVDGQCDCRRDCSSPAKHPRTANGLKDATTDPDAIRAWWALWPTANIGMVIPAGYVVVDVDTDKASAATNGHEMPTTAMSKTGRGWHFLYRTSEPVRPAVGILEHVDLRGLGSYIVAPPSRHVSGDDYVWVNTPKDGIADAPAWIYEASRPTAAPAGPGEPITEGSRNADLASLAGTMRRKGMTADEIVVALQAVNAARVTPPLSEAEVAAIAASVSRYQPAEPDGVLVLDKPKGLQFVRLVDIEPRYAEALRCGRYDPVDHTVLFGDGGTGKGIVVAYDVARLTREGEYVLIIDYERHADTEWRPRIEAAGGELDRVFIVQPDVAIWDVADQIVDGIAELSVTWAVLDSVAYACVGMEPEKSITAIRYSMAIARFPVPIISLAHTTKVDADPKHPFGSAFWSNGARITIGMSAPDEHTRLLKNRKTNQRAAFAPIEVDWSWSETEVLPPTLIEKRAVLTVADRAWDALARPLTSEALLLSVNADGAKPTTLGSLKVMLSRSRRFVSTPAGWQRAPSGLIFSANEGANGDSSETGSEGANGSANGNANRVLETANETANGTLTDRGVSSTPTLKGVTANGEPTRPLKLSIDPDLAFGPLGATGPDTPKATAG